MTGPEVIIVDAHAETIGCDGGGGALGHPLVYYNFGTKTEVVCGYCGRIHRKPTHVPPSESAVDA